MKKEKYFCPKCASENTKIVGYVTDGRTIYFHIDCKNCEHKWEEEAKRDDVGKI